MKNDQYPKFKELYLKNTQMSVSEIISVLGITSHRSDVFIRNLKKEGFKSRKEIQDLQKSQFLQMRIKEAASSKEIAERYSVTLKSITAMIGGVKSEVSRKCKICDVPHWCEYGSGEFCSEICARKESAKHFDRDAYWKVNRPPVKMHDHECVQCHRKYQHRLKRSKYCSKECWVIPTKSEERKQKCREAQLKRMSMGLHTGWKSRKKANISYPEKFFMKALDDKQLKYEHELTVGKYFIDFAFVDKMIALEIDGKQHEYPERKKKDAEKDAFLLDSGWKVVRIKWLGVNNKDKFTEMMNHFNAFVELLGVS